MSVRVFSLCAVSGIFLSTHRFLGVCFVLFLLSALTGFPSCALSGERS